jgi:hypothetical protein
MDRRLELDGKRKFQLPKEEQSLRAQVSSEPPYNLLWSFFDLSEIRLYAGDAAEAKTLVEGGLEHITMTGSQERSARAASCSRIPASSWTGSVI